MGRVSADHPDLQAGIRGDRCAVAIAVTASTIRLFPMVVALLPLMCTPGTKRRYLPLVAHLTAVTLWVKCYRFLPHVPRQRRIVLSGLGCGLVRDRDRL